MTTTKKDWLLNNYINGNISDFKKSIKFISKYDLLDFIEYCNDENLGGNSMVRSIKNLLD